MNLARARLRGVAVLVAVIGLPLLGAAWAGRDLDAFRRFPPPLQIPTNYVRFSWLAAGLVAAAIVVFFLPWIRKGAVSRTAPRAPTETKPAFPFPSWGWLALVWTLAWWFLAWTRLAWFEPGQRYTFFPLWLGFIVTVHALIQRRTGTCALRRRPARWLALFAMSAVFWWSFEWLNRFVENWHYLGAEIFGPAGYAVHATICFATVLPAVAAVAEWLDTHPGWTTRVAAGPDWRWLGSPRAGGFLLLLGAVALVLTGAWPAFFYPTLWLAPLALLLGENILAQRPGVWAEIAASDWRRAATWMFAALICGFFWEMWNWHSLAKWIYTVPGVDRWHIFEMPLLGYAGYIPFGLECLVVVEMALGREARADGDVIVKSSEPKPIYPSGRGGR